VTLRDSSACMHVHGCSHNSPEPTHSWGPRNPHLTMGLRWVSPFTLETIQTTYLSQTRRCSEHEGDTAGAKCVKMPAAGDLVGCYACSLSGVSNTCGLINAVSLRRVEVITCIWRAMGRGSEQLLQGSRRVPAAPALLLPAEFSV
jgi:hypothetical protein